MSKTIAPSPARLQADDAAKLDRLALYLDAHDQHNGTHVPGISDESQRDLRRIARYLRESFPDTINQPTTK